MDIAGGLYRERCYIPKWDALFGSGGRAAAAISILSPGGILHTYVENFDNKKRWMSSKSLHFFKIEAALN